MKPWHEQDAFWETAAPRLFREGRWTEAPAEVEKIASLLEISSGACVLDLCCGVGRHSLEFARRGFRVTGVDRTSAYLQKARELAQADGLHVEFVQDDMRTFRRTEAFDIVVNLWTSFGYFENPEEDRQVLMNVYQSLRFGGSFVMDVIGKEVLARIFRERDWHEDDEGFIVLQEHKLFKNWSWIENRWIFLKGDKRTELKLSHRLYSAEELSSLVGKCGFRRVDVYGDLAGSPYDQTAKRLVVVAGK